jgi:hypothetical protein
MFSALSNCTFSDSCSVSSGMNALRTIYQFNFKRRVERKQEGRNLKRTQAYVSSENTEYNE